MERNTYTAGEDLTANVRVKIKSGTTTDPLEVELADDHDWAIGFTEMAAASGALVPVESMNITTKRKAVAGEAFVLGAPLYGDDDGKVGDTDPEAGSGVIAIALEAATADGDIVDIQPI